MQPLLATMLITYVFGSMSCGGGSSGTTGSGGSSGTTGSSGTNSSSTSGTAQPYTGSVGFAAATEAGNPYYSALVTMLSTPAGGEPGFCPAPGVKNGSCCYVPPITGTSSGGLPTEVNAGTVTFTDGSATLATSTYSNAGGLGSYSVPNSSTTSAFKWNPGDTLGASAAGDSTGIAAFTGSVVAPASFAGVTPALTGTVTVPLASAFTLSWTASTANQVIMDLDDTTAESHISCAVDDSAGSISVAAALLGNFKSGDTGQLILDRQAYGSLSSASSNANVGVVAGTTVTGTLAFQ